MTQISSAQLAHPIQLPAELAAVALVDAKTCAASGGMSVSWWHDKVAAGQAPQPVIRGPRCTRWRLRDVAEFWHSFATQDHGEAGDKLRERATKASAAAKARRASQGQQ